MIALHGDRHAEAVPVSVNLVQRIREEFEEAPGLTMSVAEASRFWGLDEATCDVVVEQLRTVGFLARGGDGRYRQSHE
jgi:DNA-binding IclR family transcriptional regulator